MEYINKVETDSELLDRLISDYGPHKYKDLVMAMQWARHLRHLEICGKDGSKSLLEPKPLSELIEQAMISIAQNEVTLEQIRQAAIDDEAMDKRLAQRRFERARQQEAPVSEEEIKKFSSEDDK